MQRETTPFAGRSVRVQPNLERHMLGVRISFIPQPKVIGRIWFVSKQSHPHLDHSEMRKLYCITVRISFGRPLWITGLSSLSAPGGGRHHRPLKSAEAGSPVPWSLSPCAFHLGVERGFGTPQKWVNDRWMAVLNLNSIASFRVLEIPTSTPKTESAQKTKGTNDDLIFNPDDPLGSILTICN